MWKNISRAALLTVFCAVEFLQLSAQDPQFTQFYANPLYLNPAFAGSEKCPRVTLNYRDQWPGLSGHFVTMTAGYDQYVPAISGGLGLQILRDQAGESTLTTNRIKLQYAYTFNLSRGFALRFGAEAGFFQKSLDWSKLTFGDMIDPRKGFIYETEDKPRGGDVKNVDFAAGLLGFSQYVYFGLAVHHLTQPNESLIIGDSPLPRKITVHGGAKIPIRDIKYSSNSSSFISPNFLYQTQGDFRQLLVGLYMARGPVVGGVWYRNKDSFILLLGVQTGRLKFGYSYDVTVSRLTTKTAGSHEISLGIELDCRPQKRKFRTISCPSF